MGTMNEMQAMSRFLQPPKAVSTQLTSRQLEVLALLCEGLQNKQIARRLNIAAATVKIHVTSILRALKVSSRLEAVVVAISLGVEPESGNVSATPEKTVSALRTPTVLRVVPNDNHASGVAAYTDWSLTAAAG